MSCPCRRWAATRSTTAATDDASIAAGLRALLDRPQHRAGLAAAAVARADEFTWQRAARTHLAAFEAALGGKKRTEVD